MIQAPGVFDSKALFSDYIIELTILKAYSGTTWPLTSTGMFLPTKSFQLLKHASFLHQSINYNS
jgi:hypothetical protein